MFNLTPLDLDLNILDCAAGPASFNVEMTQNVCKVTSCDPIYQFSVDEISERIDQTYPIIIKGVEASLNSYVWKEIASPEELGQVRMAAMQKFLDDFPKGLTEGRYIVADLPDLPWRSQQFDLALCSHFLFAYSDQLSEEFHLKAIANLLRVAKEVRIFPILTISGELSPYLDTAIKTFTEQGYQAKIQQVAYEFQHGGNQMLSVRPLT